MTKKSDAADEAAFLEEERKFDDEMTGMEAPPAKPTKGGADAAGLDAFDAAMAKGDESLAELEYEKEGQAAHDCKVGHELVFLLNLQRQAAESGSKPHDHAVCERIGRLVRTGEPEKT